MWGKYCRVGQATDGNMATARYMLVTEACKYTNSEYVIIIALPLQQRLHEQALLLRQRTFRGLLVVQSFRKPVALPCSGRKYEIDLLHLLY